MVRRKLNSEFKHNSKEVYSSFLNSVVSKSSLKAFTPITIETVGIISCLLIIFLSEGLDKIAFIAFVVRLIASFNRLSNAYQGIVSKKAIEDHIIEKLLPGENDIQASMQIIDIVERSSKTTWTQNLADFSHKVSNTLKDFTQFDLEL